MELADVLDSKSSGSDTVRVRPPLPAPEKDLVERQGLFQLNPPLRVGEIVFDDEIQLRWVKSASTADGWI